MAYYIDNLGQLHTYEINSPNTIKLDTGTIVEDPPRSGQMFATKESAEKYQELLELYGDPKDVMIAHSKWIKDGAP